MWGVTDFVGVEGCSSGYLFAGYGFEDAADAFCWGVVVV